MVNLANVRKRSGFGLIEILVVIVIIGILVTLLIPLLTGDGKNKKSPRQKAKEVVTYSYISQIQQAISMYKMDNEAYPPNLQALKKYGVLDEMIVDQNTKQPIPYDPRTGKVGPEALAAMYPPPQPGVPGQPAPPAPPARPGNGTIGPGGVMIPNIPQASMDSGEE